MVVPDFLPKSYYIRTCTNYNTLYIYTSCQKVITRAPAATIIIGEA